jgi:hypothetical protein
MHIRKIERLKQLAASYKGSAGLVAQAIAQVIAKASADAEAFGADVAATIAGQGARIGAEPTASRGWRKQRPAKAHLHDPGLRVAREAVGLRTIHAGRRR